MLSFISSLFKFYINASVHVALSVYALLYTFVSIQGLDYDENLMYTVFFGTITGYNFVKYAPVARLHHRSLAKSLRLIQIFSMVCFVILLHYLAQLPLRTVGVFAFGLLLIIAYAVPILKQKNLRSIGYLKIYLVAICWGLVVVVAPAIHFRVEFFWIIFGRLLQTIALVVALIIPFDIRDLEHDPNTLYTIPQRFGIAKAKSIAITLLLSCLIMDTILDQSKSTLLASLATTAISAIMVLSMPKKSIKYYCSFGIESIPILKCLLYLFI